MQVIQSPAKINLILKVLSRRPDGYHTLYSVVSPVSLFDTVHIGGRRDGEVVVDDDRGILPKGEGNTVYRAAWLLKKTFGISEGIDIFLEKRIPIGSGLGGPSSNAASVIKALIERWDLTVSREQLLNLGTAVGADVPLFLYGKSCIMEGIGEKITPVSIPPFWSVIVYPGVAVSTAQVYGQVKIVLTNGANDIKLIRNFETIQDVAQNLENDLEHVGITMCSTIGSVKERLVRLGSLGTLMSGSGSSVFGIFREEREAEAASVCVNDLGNVFVVHSL